MRAGYSVMSMSSPTMVERRGCVCVCVSGGCYVVCRRSTPYLLPCVEGVCVCPCEIGELELPALGSALPGIWV